MKKVLFLLLAFCSCQVPSKVAMEGTGGRTSYNIAIQMTNSQQMLLNLVRLRYVDIPFFLEVSSVTTQFTYRGRASPTIPIPGFNEENPFTLGGEWSWQDQPTISYSPLEGRAFAERLLRPISLTTIQSLIYSGWEVDRVFQTLVQNFDELYDSAASSGPLPESPAISRKFTEAISILRFFQERGELQIGVKVKGDGDKSEEQSLQIVIPDKGEQAQRLLQIVKRARRIPGRIMIDLELGFNQWGHVGLLPRSILASMYFLSQCVDVPGEHEECHYVKSVNNEAMSCKNSILNVYTSPLPPKNAYVAVKYRKNWFYIDESDLSSKKTFVLLLQLYNLHADQPSTRGPILTLPIGT